MIEEIKKGSKYKLIVNISENGKRIARKSKTVECSGKREANKLYAEFERQVKAEFTYTGSMLSEIIERYIANCRVRGLSPTTIHKYTCTQKRIFSFLTDKSAIKVSSVDVSILVAKMHDFGYSPKTIKNAISLLSSAFDREVKLGTIPKNPCKGVELPKLTKKEPNTISPDDIQRFMAILDDFELDVKVGLELALFKGLRRSEIMGLKPCDFRSDENTIWVRRSRHKINQKMVVKEPKTATSYRLLTLPTSLADDIRELIKQHNEANYDCEDWLILYFGKAMDVGYLNNKLSRKLKEQNMQHISLHGLRHSFATMLLNSQEVDIAQISRELGHSNITTTLNIYSHASGGQLASSKAVSSAINNIIDVAQE